MRRSAIVLGAALASGCAASISVAEHRAALTEDRRAYEARLAEAEREVAAAARAVARCEEDRRQDRAVAQARADRLEAALTAKEAQLRARRARGPRDGSTGDRPGSDPAALRASLSPWLDANPAAGARAADRALVVTVPADALFTAGVARVSAEGEAMLRSLVAALPPLARLDVRVHGAPLPPGGAGPWPSAWAFTAARAAAVAAALQSAGADPSRLVAASAGARHPAVAGEPAERIEVLVTTPGG